MPYFFRSQFGFEAATISTLTTLYNVGSVLGSIIGGFLMDFTKVKSIVIWAMVIGSLPFIFAFSLIG